MNVLNIFSTGIIFIPSGEVASPLPLSKTLNFSYLFFSTFAPP
jgi:hypothetical protein